MSSAIVTVLRELDHGDEKKLRAYFDDIIRKVPTDDKEYLYEIVNALIEVNLLSTHIIDHPFFAHIRDTCVDILQKPVDEFNLLCRIGQLFSQLTDRTDDKSIHLFQQLFADATTIECLSKSLKNLSPTSHANLIDGIGHLIDAYRKFQKDRPPVQDDLILSRLIMPIVDFVNSAQCKSSFFQLLTQQDKLTCFQNLILVTCPKYVISFLCKRYQEVSCVVAQETLNRSSDLLEHFLPFVNDWKEPVIWCVAHLICLCQYSAGEHLLSAYNAEHKKIFDHVLEIVQAEKLWSILNQDFTFGNLQKRTSLLFCDATLYIYTMSFSPELRHKLKERKIILILLRLTETNFDKIQFHAYRTLAAVLTDDDIKQLANPAQITTVFITYLKKSIDIIAPRRRLENLLLNLKNLIQHDQIKAEFVKQADGLPLLIRCATESQFDPVKVQLRALEILMSLTFNDEAETWIRQNETFVQHLRTLTSNSNVPGLQKVADGILWRLFSKYGTTESEFQYDVMISYSHKDKDICHRIFKALNDDNFRVWIDLERMHGAMMQAMADAVKQSRCVLICMSDSYYLSPYCQAEAQYAFEKRRCLLPLRVQSGYKADGWLAFLTSGRVYVDFMKMDFDTSYVKLVSEIRQSKVDGKDSLVILSRSNVLEAPTARSERTAYSPSTDVLQWSPADVRNFLIAKELHQMLPICQLMDGRAFMELYKMCRINSPVMLHTLRSETMELHSAPLSTNIYLTFLHEMTHLKPEEKSSSIASRSQICTLI